MTPKRFMLIAGEASGDVLGAELVKELRVAALRRDTYSVNVQPLEADLAPRFFGAGGPRMAEAGVEIAFDLTQHSVTGLPSLGEYLRFRKVLNELVEMACDRQPHVIICIDFPLFNAVLAAAIRKRVKQRKGTFNNWKPKLIKYISPQVWASREHRAYQIARDFDLVLSIFPFEKEWYAARVPKLRVEFIGHPMLDRHEDAKSRGITRNETNENPLLILLPGSRRKELERHLPVLLGALEIIRSAIPNVRAQMVLPAPVFVEQAKTHALPPGLEVRCGGLAETLSQADVAIASTGTVTMECAYFGVPTVTLYKTSRITWEIGKRIVKVKSLTMPNLLANETVFPEFIQPDATVQNISRAALELLRDSSRREKVRARLAQIIAALGGPGASQRAAEAIFSFFN